MLAKNIGKYLLLGTSFLMSLEPVYASDSKTVANRHEIKLKLNDPLVTVNGQSQTLPAPPTLVNNTTMVPLRFVAESLGIEVKWDQPTRTITLSTAAKTIRLTVDSPDAAVNGVSVPLEQPATILNETTMVPLRFISENMNQTVAFDNSTLALTITSKENDSASPEQAIAPVKKKKDKPTVDNLSTALGSSQVVSAIPGPYGYTDRTITDIVSDHDSNVYMIDFNLKRYKYNYGISVYNQNTGDGKNIQHAVIFDEKFNIEYKDKENFTKRLIFDDITPKKLFYDNLHNKLYLLAKVEKLLMEEVTIIYEVLPDVKMVTYSLDSSMNEETNFVAALDEKHLYYSNTFLGQVYSFQSQNGSKVVGYLLGNQKPSLVSVVNDSYIYLLDKVNKIISKINTDGTISEVAKINIERIYGATSQDGYFYISDEKGVYRIDIDGSVDNYLNMADLSYNRGLLDPRTQTYEPSTIDYVILDGVSKPIRDHEPSPLSLGNYTFFTVDSKGNIIIYDNFNQILRRINVY
jgi:hypothetical protein